MSSDDVTPQDATKYARMMEGIKTGEISANIIASRIPELDPVAYYGLLGLFAEETTKQTDLCPAAVSFHLLAHFAARFGHLSRVPLKFKHLPIKFYGVAIGDSEAGHKSQAMDFAALVFRRIDELLPSCGFLGDSPGLKAPRIIYQIPNGETMIQDVKDPHVKDKRVLYCLDPINAFFASAARSGSTLLSTVLAASQGLALRGIVRSRAIEAKTHHLSIVANATPGGYLHGIFREDIFPETMSRFLVCFSTTNRREHGFACIPQSVIDNFAYNIIARVHNIVGDNVIQVDSPPLFEMEYTPDAFEAWPIIENAINPQQYPNEYAKVLGSQARFNIWNLAALIALFNGEMQVTKEILLSATAWIDHSREAIDVLTASPNEIAKARRAEKVQARILLDVARNATPDAPLVPWAMVQRLVRQALKCSAAEFQDGVKALVDAQPTRLHVVEVAKPNSATSLFLAMPKDDERRFLT